MKKICLLTILLFAVCAANAQNEVTQPAPPPQQEHGMTKMLAYNFTLAFITMAKNDGITPEELGKKLGETFPWGEDATLQALAISVLQSMQCMSANVSGSKLSDDKWVIFIPIAPMKNQGAIYGSTLEDYVAFWNGAMGEIANNIGMSCEFSLEEEVIQIVIAQ